jgi:hypothetical protein
MGDLPDNNRLLTYLGNLRELRQTSWYCYCGESLRKYIIPIFKEKDPDLTFIELYSSNEPPHMFYNLEQLHSLVLC